jgi:hypothetical protein
MLTLSECASYQTLSLGDDCLATTNDVDDKVSALSNMVCYDMNEDGSFNSATKYDGSSCDLCQDADASEPVTPLEEPLSPEEPVVPEEEPVTPEEPLVPEEVPVVPEEPATPEEPLAPEEEPVTPEEPAVPEESEVLPEEPAVPEESEVLPEEPAVPEESEVLPEEPAVPEEVLFPTTAPTPKDELVPVIADTIPVEGVPTAAADDCPMDYLTVDTGTTACPSPQSIVTLTAIVGYDGLVDAHGEGVIYGIQLDESGSTVSFNVNNPFDDSADVFVKHESLGNVDGFLEPICEEEQALPPCLEADSILDNTFTVACRSTGFAKVYVYFATSDPTVLAFTGEDATIHDCCYPPAYDLSTTGLVEFVYHIDCSCPPMAEGRYLRGSKIW